MSPPAPHFLLFTESRDAARSPFDDRTPAGRWRFVLEDIEGATLLEVEDQEFEDRQRLELLSVVRGLESLEQPSRVTLVTGSPYVSHGLRYGLAEWRRNDWQWEHFGQRIPVPNRDLWQRIDRALGFHRVHCRTWRLDDAHVARRKRTVAAPPPPRAPHCLLRAFKKIFRILEKWFSDECEPDFGPSSARIWARRPWKLAISRS